MRCPECGTAWNFGSGGTVLSYELGERWKDCTQCIFPFHEIVKLKPTDNAYKRFVEANPHLRKLLER